MLAFGGNLTGSRLISHLARNVDTILVAKYSSDYAAGLYNTASSRLFIPLQQIDGPLNMVAIPALSRLQTDPVRYRLYYLQAVLLAVMFGMPIVAFLFVAADKIILAVLSDKFIQSVPIFRAMAPGMFLWTFNVATSWVFISLGRTDRQFRWVFFSSSVTILAFFIGLRWGVVGVAAGFSVAVWLLRYPGVRFCYMDTPLKIRDLLGVLWRPALASIVAGFALFGFGLAVPLDINVVLGIIVDAVIYGIVYVLCWLVLPNGARDLLNLVAIVREVITPPKNNNHAEQQGE